MPEAFSPMLPGAPPKPGIYLARGPHLLPSWFLRALTPGLVREESLFWIDGGNPFDAFGAGRTARTRGLDPKSTLDHVLLARAFNLYQVENMVCRKLPPRWKGQPIVLSDPLPLFYDEDIPLPEVRSVLRRVVAGMRALQAVWLVLSVDKQAPKGREVLLQDLAQAASTAAHLSGGADGWLLERG